MSKKNSDFANDKTLNDKFTAAVKDNNKNEVLRMTTMKLSKNQQKYFLFFCCSTWILCWSIKSVRSWCKSKSKDDEVWRHSFAWRNSRKTR